MRKLRDFVFRLLRARPEDVVGMSYRDLVEKQDKERALFQRWCKHEKESLRFHPVVICQVCTKPLRYMTEEDEEKWKEQTEKTVKQITEESEAILKTREDSIL